jgi:2-dehydro-3-deoxy-D-gluconate 5-dehydrogenase
MDLFNLDGKIAVVTGGSRGLGRAMAIGLAQAGADVALVQRKPTDTAVQERITALGRKCVIIACDLGEMTQVRTVLDQVDEKIGKVDILVNSAGTTYRSPALDYPEEAWDHLMDVNLKALYLLCQQAGRRMTAKGAGKIINVASLLSFQGGVNALAYAVSKGGVAQLTKALANEWAPFGVNVNAIVPGYMDTDMNEALKRNEIRCRQILERIPAGRWGRPEDLAGSVVFLASGASDYMHGHLLVVDGGWMSR